MIAFLRLAAIGFVVLTVIYWLISVYSRSVRREALERRWEEEVAEGAAPEGRDAYIRDGMRAYERGLRRRLIGLVYVVPALVVIFLIWLNNYS
ncbi:hypothetical protein GVY41_16485 [Frigidibacter albus]|uniref:Cation/multidrug efflux pump n=2 Tax=Frigidibacter albus TaxID=1465486 RepID=A0A6L8VML3_9RHOB|nr:hypothetical protein [Frigidibacter albus]MZQ90782.1 hypothetical protein [Frigidibacter albus]NBE32600.1 hypothetical protein [Frigidibacter albus]